jgi:ABC-type sugar transport system ATPase subunit
MNLIPEKREGRELLFGIRPEHLEPCAESDAKFVIDVDLIEPLGADTLVYGHLGGGGDGVRVAARLHASLDARTGRLPLRYDPSRVHWFDAANGQRVDAVAG